MAASARNCEKVIKQNGNFRRRKSKRKGSNANAPKLVSCLLEGCGQSFMYKSKKFEHFKSQNTLKFPCKCFDCIFKCHDHVINHKCRTNEYKLKELSNTPNGLLSFEDDSDIESENDEDLNDSFLQNCDV